MNDTTKRIAASIALVAAGLAGLGCQSSEATPPPAAPEPQPQVLSAAAAVARNAASAEPAAAAEPDSPTAGCRSPTETGCNSCCEPAPNGACTKREWSDKGMAADQLTGVEPWYNVTAAVAGACPSTCARCAKCTKREEKELRSLGVRPDCDCTKAAEGVDPCFSPQSCGCFCQRSARLRAACPQVSRSNTGAR